MHIGISRWMNIVSVTFPLFLYLIRILSNDKKKRFCRNSRKLSGCRHLVFSEDPSRQRKKKLFHQICPVYSREIFFRGLSGKILKIKTESYREALRVNWKSIWRKTGNSLSWRRSTRWCFSFHLGKLNFFAEVVEDFQHCTVGPLF